MDRMFHDRLQSVLDGMLIERGNISQRAFAKQMGMGQTIKLGLASPF